MSLCTAIALQLHFSLHHLHSFKPKKLLPWFMWKYRIRLVKTTGLVSATEVLHIGPLKGNGK